MPEERPIANQSPLPEAANPDNQTDKFNKSGERFSNQTPVTEINTEKPPKKKKEKPEVK